MKTALITTTINIPTVLKLYRACGPDVAFFVTGDMKTDSIPFKQFCREIPNCYGFDAVDQSTMEWKCSDLIGWNTISRRNIALLEALKWGAEIIVTIDDDNIPMSTDYFDRFEMVLGQPVLQPHQHKVDGGWSGLAVTPEDHAWWDVGQLLIPRAPHRGFPYPVRDATLGFSYVVDAKIGVAAGICLGDPDISAVERIANNPAVLSVAEPLRAGIAVSTKTVFNSQNTAFLRELAPCFLMAPQFDRYDDIFASLIAQRVMRDRGMHVHFGQPFVWQQRNSHDLLKDLAAETWGMEHVVEFADWLDRFALGSSGGVLSHVDAIYSEMATRLPWMPPEVYALGRAWVQDVGKVL